MVALKYWELDPPMVDQDDHLLKQAIDNKVVPEKCHFNGAAVLGMAAANIDPCKTCDCPRELCGGRVALDPIRLEAVLPDQDRRAEMNQALFGGDLENDAADARKVERQLTIQGLNAIAQGEDEDP